MKRSALKHEIHRCNPWFFWVDCCKCNHQFRREKGWRAFTGPFCGGYGVFRYICSSCASSRAEAEAVVDAEPWIPGLPKRAPKAPPVVTK